jgi:hypothetical protein
MFLLAPPCLLSLDFLSGRGGGSQWAGRRCGFQTLLKILLYIKIMCYYTFWRDDMGFWDNVRAARAELEARMEVSARLNAARWAGTVLREDADPVLKVLEDFHSRAKTRTAIEAANWLLYPKREVLTPAEAKRVASGQPRHLTPLERLHLL